MTATRRLSASLVGLLGLLAAAACMPLAPQYSVEAYTNATRLKAESLALMARGTESYGRHAATAEALRLDVDAAYEFARGLPGNEVTARQWQLMRDPEAGLLFGFLDFWAARGSGLSPAFVAEYRAGVAQAFDRIICLEINKQNASACSPPAAAAVEGAE